jgi:hypothetical protein
MTGIAIHLIFCEGSQVDVSVKKTISGILILFLLFFSISFSNADKKNFFKNRKVGLYSITSYKGEGTFE